MRYIAVFWSVNAPKDDRFWFRSESDETLDMFKVRVIKFAQMDYHYEITDDIIVDEHYMEGYELIDGEIRLCFDNLQTALNHMRKGGYSKDAFVVRISGLWTNE